MYRKRSGSKKFDLSLNRGQVMESRRISILVDSILHILELVFIIEENKGYRLVVRHGGNVLIDKHFNSAKGARIAFSRLYPYKNKWEYKGYKRNSWTPFIHPEKQWLNKFVKPLIVRERGRQVKHKTVASSIRCFENSR